MQINNLQRSVILAILMIGLVTLVSGITLVMLYQAALTTEAKRLGETVNYYSSLLASLAHKEQQQNPEHSFQQAYLAAIDLLNKAQQRRTTTEMGEVTIARLDHQDIVYLKSKHLATGGTTRLVPGDTKLAEPMRRALKGEEGFMRGTDYSGTHVLAAYMPIHQYQLGAVAKVNQDEFEQPFIIAGILAALTGVTFILITTLIFFRISNKIVSSAVKSETQLDVILDTVVDGIVSINKQGVITAFNQAAEKLFGFSADEIIGKSVNTLIPESFRNKHDGYLDNYTKTEKAQILGLSREVIGQRKDGSKFPMDLAVSHARIGKDIIFTGIIRDITARKQIEQELQSHRDHLEEQVKKRTEELQIANVKLDQLARIDSLTGIANRREFDITLDLELNRASRNKTPLTLMMCDIDHFKQYNDTYGHTDGDECLQKIAQAIKATFKRAGDLVARYGGEEFSVILPITTKDEAEHLAKTLQNNIHTLNIEHTSSLVSEHVTLSIGIATLIPDSNYQATDIIDRADRALYEAKDNGRNQFIISAI